MTTTPKPRASVDAEMMRAMRRQVFAAFAYSGVEPKHDPWWDELSREQQQAANRGFRMLGGHLQGLPPEARREYLARLADRTRSQAGAARYRAMMDTFEDAISKITGVSISLSARGGFFLTARLP